MNSENHSVNSVPTLLRELRDETTTLLRQELALAKAELKENTLHLTSYALQIAIGGFVGYAGLIVLLIGLGLLISSWLVRAGMSPDIAQWLAPTLLGLIVALIGARVALRAKNAMTSGETTPRRTIATLREDKAWVESKLQHSP